MHIGKQPFAVLSFFAALILSTSPTLQAQEIGTNDFRISFMGPDGDSLFQARTPSVVYNPTANEYYTVWRSDDDTSPLVNNEFELFGQRINSATGSPIGSEVRLSFMGPDGDSNYSAGDQDVAYNSTNNEYLVVWAGDDNDGVLVVNELEIYGQRVDAATGERIGNNFRISFMQPDGDGDFDAISASVAYNSTNNEYLVVWSGESEDPPLDGDGQEIAGQRVSATGTLEGGVIQVSDMGDATIGFGGHSPSVAYNATNNEYLVVWYGDDNIAPLGNNETEIFGQRLNAATGAPLGNNDFRISEAGGPSGSNTRRALNPTVVWNPEDNQYLVVWTGERVEAPFVDEEYDVFGQILSASGGTVADDFRVSDMGPDGNANYRAGAPDADYSPAANQYLVFWLGDDDRDPLVDEEFEGFGQFLSTAGVQVGPNDFRLSDMGPDQDTDFEVQTTAVVANPTNFQFLALWSGDDNTPPLVDGETEIFGQLLVSAGCGNGVVETGEACDDGNNADGDSCSADCSTVTGSTGGGSTGGSTGGTTGTGGSSGSGGSGGDSGGGCSLIRD